MNFSIDDLATSLSSSHVGQEALDLATLHAQLTQALFGQSISRASTARQNTGISSCYTPPCNTPTLFSAFTRSEPPDEAQHQIPLSWALEGSSFAARDEMEEDERMVEDLLIPRSPIGVSLAPHHHFATSASKPQLSPNQAYDPPSSLFASTDPFYIDFCARHDASPHSIFTQLGLPPQQSPFTLQASLQMHEHPGTGRPALHQSADPPPLHSFLHSATSVPFES